MAFLRSASGLVFGLVFPIVHSFVSTRPQPQQTTTSLRVLGDRPDVSTGEDFQGPPPALLGESSFAIYDLLLQRSLQTHCYYLREARNDVKADWLMGFLDHSHLDDGIRWHSIVGMRSHLRDYFRALDSEPKHSITVVYGGERQLGLDSPSNAAPLSEAEAKAHEDLMPWASAARSRRANPYLPKPKTLEYTEEVDPHQLAEEVMDLCAVLGEEWRVDLDLLAWVDKAETRLEKAEDSQQQRKAFKEKCRLDPDDDECQLDYESFEANRSVPAFESAERGRSGESTPLRRLNYELLQRACTLLALKAVRADLAWGGMAPGSKQGEGKRRGEPGPTDKAASDAAALKWLGGFLEEGKWWEQLAGVTTSLVRPEDQTDVALDTVSDRMLASLDHRFPSLVDGRLVDPPALANQVRDARHARARGLKAELDECGGKLEELRTECATVRMLEAFVAAEARLLACLNEKEPWLLQRSFM